ncbi:hypothetical protein PSDVSF_18620 [Pseudodesulfovibrio sediminis]|uniref:Solute-binding protein family 3/N-terminal domain-containing protein n=2 Tax=Pseudodesulfovibrio sediminis TaxID=2810563 RepID=A0ABM9SDT2_9BACT|nr:hypothetical protein PSDVSF_18620 [Pseudodesulfovibrio sediminis]
MGAPCAAQKTYRISYSPEAEIHVLAQQRIKDVYERAGLAVEFVPMPHKRSIHSVVDGTVDGEAGRIAGLENKYPSLHRVKVKLIDLIGAAYVMEDSPLTRYSEELLDTVRVGAIFGVQWSKNELDGHSAEIVGDYYQLFGMLVEKRVDMVLGNTLSIEAVLRKEENRRHHLRKLKPLVFCEPLYHYVNEKNAHLVPLLEKALRELWEEDRWGERFCVQDKTDSAPKN